MRRLVAASIFVLLTACGGSGALAPVGRSPDATNGRIHVVQRGETLYSIAWRYRADYRDLARINAIPAPFVIYPGQKLITDVTARNAAATGSARRAEVSRKGVRRRGSGRSTKARPAPRTRPPAAAARSAGTRRGRNRVRHTIAWRWPVRGRVLRTFKQSGNRGLDISGRRGHPIKAAAAGRVVYSGSGLLGYGKLIIIKHDKRFLSAYAHNNKLLAEEGDRVASGEHIADMGDTGTDRVMLHFEIRRDGKPVDPARYLSR